MNIYVEFCRMGRVECSESAEGFSGPGRANPPDGRFISISADDEHTCGVRDDGKLECWGWYPFLQNIPESGNFVQVVSTGSIACALSLDGSVECWGASTPPAEKSSESISLAVGFSLRCIAGWPDIVLASVAVKGGGKVDHVGGSAG